MSEELEYRVYWHMELMCPNPREFYQNTRSFQSMVDEYNLLHCDEIDPMQMSKLCNSFENYKTAKRIQIVLSVLTAVVFGVILFVVLK